MRGAPATPISADGGRMSVYPTVIGVFADNSVLARRPRSIKRPERSKLIVDSTTYLVITNQSSRVLGDYFSKEHWDYFFKDGVITFGDTPFGRVGATVVDGQSFFTSNGVNYEITEHDRNGKPTRVMRIVRPTASVTPARIAEFKKTFAESGDKHRNDAIMDWMPFARSAPAFTGLLRDRSGRTWAAVYDFNAAVSGYEVFDNNGRWLGTVKLPDHSLLLDAGRDWLLLRVLPPDGEPLVQLHRLAPRS
jgi:hypothetical protein